MVRVECYYVKKIAQRHGPHGDTETGAHQGNNLTHNENSFMHASQEGRENANIDAGWGFIWRISAYINTVIFGWVANWRPIEIFLYEWWPIVRRRNLYRRLAAAEVNLTPFKDERLELGSDPASPPER